MRSGAWLGQQGLDERTCRRTPPLTRPHAESDGTPIPTEDEARGKSDRTIQTIVVARRIKQQGKGQAQLRGVARHCLLVFPGVDPDDGESSPCELSVESLQYGHLRATLETPARPEI